MEKLKMSSGQKIPRLALGLWKIEDKKVLKKAFGLALKCGYTHFDSAQIYDNEGMLGQAINESGVDREDLFITTKLWNDNQWYEDVVPSFEESLKKLQTSYVDLFLVHFPVTESRKMAWLQMEKIYKSGKAKSIGVSNYTVKHLEELLSWAEIKPTVNQVELHVYLQQPDLLEYCKEYDIVVEAYSPLAHGEGLDNKVLASIAKKHGKTAAQIMIRWCLEVGTVPLPKSTHPDRIRQNIDVFDFKLDSDDMQKIKELDSGLRTCWDPTNIA